MTGRTTAHIMAWNDDFYSKIAKQHGEVICKLVGDSHRAAIDFVERTVREEGIECKFQRVDGYLFPHKESNQVMELLHEEFESSKLAGFDVRMVDLNKDPSCGRISNAIHFPRNGDFHPLMYLDGLAKAIVKRGGKIYEGCRVYEPIDSLHLIGYDPFFSGNVFVATGDSGQGMTGGTIAGILLKDLILRRENAWENAYKPSRLPPLEKSTIEAASEIVDHTVKGYASKAPIIGVDDIDIEDILPNSGAVKQEGLHKVAIYKDIKGQIHLIVGL